LCDGEAAAGIPDGHDLVAGIELGDAARDLLARRPVVRRDRAECLQPVGEHEDAWRYGVAVDPDQASERMNTFTIVGCEISDSLSYTKMRRLGGQCEGWVAKSAVAE
jgi:hypothetical protein